MYEYRVIEIGPARRQERHALNPNGPDIEAILNEHAAEGFRLVQVLASGDRPHMAAQMLVLERELPVPRMGGYTVNWPPDEAGITDMTGSVP